MDNKDIISFPKTKSTIRSIEEIIKQDEDRKAQQSSDNPLHQIFNAPIQNVINVSPGGIINIFIDAKEVDHV